MEGGTPFTLLGGDSSGASFLISFFYFSKLFRMASSSFIYSSLSWIMAIFTTTFEKHFVDILNVFNFKSEVTN